MTRLKPDTAAARRLVLAGGAALLAAPAMAQESPPDVAPDAVARFALEVCVTEELPEAMPATGDFARVSGDETSATFEHPDGPTLTLARRPDFWSCRLEVAGASQGWFDEMAQTVAPAMAERFATQDFEQVEDGLLWDLVTPAGTALTTELRLREGGTVVLTSQTGPSDPASPDRQEE